MWHAARRVNTRPADSAMCVTTPVLNVWMLVLLTALAVTKVSGYYWKMEGGKKVFCMFLLFIAHLWLQIYIYNLTTLLATLALYIALSVSVSLRIYNLYSHSKWTTPELLINAHVV